jgi:hypothetical protein
MEEQLWKKAQDKKKKLIWKGLMVILSPTTLFSTLSISGISNIAGKTGVKLGSSDVDRLKSLKEV